MDVVLRGEKELEQRFVLSQMPEPVEKRGRVERNEAWHSPSVRQPLLPVEYQAEAVTLQGFRVSAWLTEWLNAHPESIEDSQRQVSMNCGSERQQVLAVAQQRTNNVEQRRQKLRELALGGPLGTQSRIDRSIRPARGSLLT